MEKRYLSSAQFAKLCGITKDALMWYEKKGLLKPEFIGENGYHYYSYEQYFEVDLVKTLRVANVSLADCRKYMRNRTSENYFELMLRQQEVLSDRIRELQAQKADVDFTIRDCLTMQSRYSQRPRMIVKEERHFIVEPIIDNSSEGIAKAFQKLFENRRKFQTLYKTSTTMLNGMIIPLSKVETGAFRKPSAVCLKINEAIPEKACLTVPAGENAVLFHKGSRDTIENSYFELLEFITKSGAKPCGDAIEADFINYLSYGNEENYIKQVSIPIVRL